MERQQEEADQVMAAVRVSSSRSIEGAQLTVGDYRQLFDGLDDSVVVNSHSYSGDRPWESGSTRVTVDASVNTTKNGGNTATDWNGTWETTR